MNTRALDRLYRTARIARLVCEYAMAAGLGFMLLYLVAGTPAFYVGVAYGILVLVLGRVLKRLAKRLREVAGEMYASGRITTKRYNEVAVLVNSILSQGPPLPGDRTPMPLRST